MRRQLIGLAGAACTAIVGCTTPVTSPGPSAPAARAAAQPKVQMVSAESQALKAHYAKVQQGLLAQDLLRTDGGGPDTPYSAAMVVRNFQQIALFEEYARVGSSIVAKKTESNLHRWERPIRMSVEFGGVISREQIQSDRRVVENFALRLGRITGHPISTVATDPNFHVFIVDEDARRAMGDRLREIIPSISPTAVAAVTNLPRSSYCLVFAWDPEGNGTYQKAVAIIRAEHPDLLRRSCIHEELAQGMGLSNDSPQARPSVFNDDEEFGLLTSHDEELLRILYDPRLRPGMSSDEAMPIVQTIVAQRMGSAS